MKGLVDIADKVDEISRAVSPLHRVGGAGDLMLCPVDFCDRAVSVGANCAFGDRIIAVLSQWNVDEMPITTFGMRSGAGIVGPAGNRSHRKFTSQDSFDLSKGSRGKPTLGYLRDDRMPFLSLGKGLTALKANE